MPARSCATTCSASTRRLAAERPARSTDLLEYLAGAGSVETDLEVLEGYRHDQAALGQLPAGCRSPSAAGPRRGEAAPA